MVKKLLLIIFCAFLLACSDSKQTSQKEVETKVETITPASLHLFDLNGDPVATAELKGKRIFLNFWATWCKPCLAEMPSIDRAALALADKNVIFIAASDEKPEKVETFKEKNNYKFEIVSTKADLSTLGIYALPATFIFDESGKLVHKETGAREWDSPESIQLITESK